MPKQFARNKAKANAKKLSNDQKDNADLEVRKSMLIYSAVVSVRHPSKKAEAVCKQLRKILSPDCLSKIEVNPKLQDIVDVAAQLLVKQIIYISENEIRIALLPTGPTYSFKIIEYENNFKNFPNDIYWTTPFITFEGKSSTKTLFQNFGTMNRSARRALHFHFDDDLVHIRHYATSIQNTDENFVVHLKEIGPKLALKLLEVKNGVFPGMNLKHTQRYR
ncbi:uncharacterized protein VICG_00931 [Vittaforma corneae ATCC 50505]|uniref:Brix domain-containing protein n=1 Tax=Vittaforma corneae (strain ATCC 50505) TaxID=993615 RepID=L2GP50_VITCO|nr:uncharacterized protein VICG_00931 [Vittaforma corneae ATCC 50505]ELA42082.1 hypothetical protein VICG_00931 [Vittaforma corneae ATCC 50505]